MMYYHKINIDYDKQQLLDVADKYMHLAKDGFTDAKGNYIKYSTIAEQNHIKSYSTKSLYFKDIPESFKEWKIFKDLSATFNRSLDDIYNCAQYFIIEGALSPHIDKRSAAFTIPLKGVDTPVVWYDSSDNVLDTYLYEGPTLIDTGTKHGAIDNQEERLHFQIGGFTEPFSKIVEKL